MGKSSPSLPPPPDPSEFRLAQFTPQGSLVFGDTDSSGRFVFDPNAADSASKIQESPFSQTLRLRQENIGDTLAQLGQAQARGLDFGRLTTAGLPSIPGFTPPARFDSPFGYSAPSMPARRGSQSLSVADQILGAGGAQFVQNNLGDFGSFGLNVGQAAIEGTPAIPGTLAGDSWGWDPTNPNRSEFGPMPIAQPGTPATPGTPAVAASSFGDIENMIRGNPRLQAQLVNQLSLSPVATTAPGGKSGLFNGALSGLPTQASAPVVAAQAQGIPSSASAPVVSAQAQAQATAPSTDAARRQAQAAFFAQQMALLNPQFDRAENRLRQSLANRGQPIAPGTAGGDEFRQFQDAQNRSREEAARSAVFTGNDEFARQVALAQGVRGQEFGERSSLRQNQFNELAALLGGQQIVGSAPTFALPNPADAANAARADRMAQFNADSAMQQANKAGMSGIAAAALPIAAAAF